MACRWWGRAASMRNRWGRWGGAPASMLNRCGRHGGAMAFAFDDLMATEWWRRELRTASGGGRGSYGIGLPRRRATVCGHWDAKNTTWISPIRKVFN
jgi:hypothetical protein